MLGHQTLSGARGNECTLCNKGRMTMIKSLSENSGAQRCTLNKISQRISLLFQLLLAPRSAVWVIRRRSRNVIHTTQRAIVSRVIIGGKACVRKVFHPSETGVQCYRREVLARELFKQRPWMSPIIKKGHGWLAVPYYPEEMRLDRAAPGMDESMRFDVAKRAVEILYEIFSAGYAHCDFHAGNVFWVDNELIVTDFETMQKYPVGQRPAFASCYDITGRGLDSPFMTRNMCYTAKDDFSHKALEYVLGIPVEEVLDKSWGPPK